MASFDEYTSGCVNSASETSIISFVIATDSQSRITYMIGENAASKSKLNFNQSDYEVVDEANEN